MIAILGGIGTAALWATTLLGSARASRVIGAWSTLAWVMLVGLAIAIPFLIVGGGDVRLTERDLLHFAVAGVANTGGLLFVYTALRRGKVAVVGPIVSTEGAIAATLAVLAGDTVAGPAVAVLALIAVGVILAATERSARAADPAGDPPFAGASFPAGDPPPAGDLPGTVSPAPAEIRPPPGAAGPPAFVVAPGALGTALLALAGALLFGVNLYVTSRLATDLPLAWAVLPARVAGVLGVTLPLVLTRRLRLTRAVAPFVILVGVAEVAGVVTFGIGARESAAVTAVIASQFAGIAAVAAFLLFGERLGRIQVAGVVIIALGVAALAYLQP